MKRFMIGLVSVFVLLIAVQPVFAFHFCAERLASVGIPALHEASGCCSATSPDEALPGLTAGSGCCHTSVVGLDTDDYLQQDTHQQAAPFSPLAFIYAGSFVSDIISEPASASRLKIPPAYLHPEGRDLLTRFCVYII